MVRGEVFRLPAPSRARGHEQRGARFAVVVQSDDLLELSTVLVAPMSTSARPATFRPVVQLLGQESRVLVGDDVGHAAEPTADEIGKHRGPTGFALTGPEPRA